MKQKWLSCTKKCKTGKNTPLYSVYQFERMSIFMLGQQKILVWFQLQHICARFTIQPLIWLLKKTACCSFQIVLTCRGLGGNVSLGSQGGRNIWNESWEHLARVCTVTGIARCPWALWPQCWDILILLFLIHYYKCILFSL